MFKPVLALFFVIIHLSIFQPAYAQDVVFDDIVKVSTMGIDQNNLENVLSLLTINWEKSLETTGVFQLVFSGQGIISLRADCINVLLRDVTRPYQAPSKRRPKHEDV